MASLYCLALALRWVPLVFSPLPFNIDGFPLARIAAQLGDTGVWRPIPSDVNSYNLTMPVYSLLWSAVAGLGGVGPLDALQVVMPALASAVVLPAYLLGAKATRNPVAALAAGLFAAVFGSFLFLTSAAMKETVGLVLLPAVVLLYAERADPRRRGLAVLLLLILPLLHHLTTLLALGMVSALVVLSQARDLERGSFRGRRLLLDVATGPALAIPAWAYYQSVQLAFLGALVSADAMALFLSVTVLLAAGLVAFRRPKPRRVGHRLASPTAVVVVPVAALAVLLVNGRLSLFAGALGTQAALLPVLVAVAALVGLAVPGYALVRRTTNRVGDVVMSMLVAPTALVLFGFLRGLDPMSLAIIYRSFDFLDYAVAVLVGIGFAWAWVRLRPSRAARVALGAAFLGLLLATTPMAWNSQAVFGVDNVTTPAEFQALSVLASLRARNVTTDQRLADVGAWWFGLGTAPDLPLLLRDNASPEGHDYALLEERWTTVGAQEHPAPNVVVSRAALEAFLEQNRVVYVAGPEGDRVFVLQIVAPV